MKEEIINLQKETVSFVLETMKSADKKDPASVAAAAELLKVAHSLIFNF